MSKQRQLASALLERHRRRQSQFYGYQPSEKQLAFHAAGQHHRERLLMAGNQLGKTTAGAHEMAMHLTGLYPNWWQGRRFDAPVAAWLGSVSQEVSRDTVQKLLIGDPKADPLSLKALLPKKLVKSTNKTTGLEALAVKHSSGGTSVLAFKSYAQGRERWQGATLDLLWFDEEPPYEIYAEGLTRTNATGGMVYATFTPLLGQSTLVQRFTGKAQKDRKLVQLKLDDATHLSDEVKDQIRQSYPSHERQVRADGQPVLGSGRVFAVPIDDVTVRPFDLPDHWPRVAALDFGWDHPTAAVELAWDRDRDVAYLVKSYRRRQATPQVHAATLLKWGQGLPWVWPHDGLAHDKTSGVTLAGQYRDNGLLMQPERVTFPDGSNGLEAGVMAMLERLESKKLRLFDGQPDWVEEYGLYHRKNGLIVAERDDLMSATRYALMGLRFAKPPDRTSKRATLNEPAFNPLDW